MSSNYINPDIHFASTKTIRVLILTPNSNKKELIREIWERIREKLKHKYQFVETNIKTANFNKMISMIHRGEQDLVIAPFQITQERASKVDFTYTILESKDSILYFPKMTTFAIIKMLLFKVFLGPIIALFVFGFLFGIALYYFEPKRYLRASKVSKKNALRRYIVTATSALFGEAGYLSENTTLTIKGIILMFIIMLFAFFFVMYIQAVTTEKVLDIRKINTITRDNISEKTLLSPKGYAIAKNLERLGANIKYVKKSLDDIIQDYIRNPDSADGVVIDYIDAKTREKPDIKLITNESELGYKEIAFAVSKNEVNLLRDLNLEIIRMQDSLETERICKGYIPHDAAYLCVK
jgi:hypothetical protein